MLKELKNVKIIPLEDLTDVHITNGYLIISFKNIGNTKLPKIKMAKLSRNVKG